MILNNLLQDAKNANCLITCMDLIVNWQVSVRKCGFCIMCDRSNIDPIGSVNNVCIFVLCLLLAVLSFNQQNITPY